MQRNCGDLWAAGGGGALSEVLAKRQGRVAGHVGIVWPGCTLVVERSWADKACWDLSWLGTVPGGRLLPCWEGSAFPLFPGLLTLSRPICLHPSVPSPPFFPRQAVERGAGGGECGASACCPRCSGRVVFIVSDMQSGFHSEKILFSR